MTNAELHSVILERGQDFKRSESALLEAIQWGDERKIYLEYGFSSLHVYVVQAIGLSDDHVRPWSEGGEHSVENLVTLCSAHHQHLHAGSDEIKPCRSRRITLV